MLLDEIEPGVRNLVCWLRNHGINTECSCHHKWYVQCQTTDPTTELTRIYVAMVDVGIKKYRVEFTREVDCHGSWHQSMEIKFDPTQAMLEAVKKETSDEISN